MVDACHVLLRSRQLVQLEGLVEGGRRHDFKVGVCSVMVGVLGVRVYMGEGSLLRVYVRLIVRRCV